MIRFELNTTPPTCSAILATPRLLCDTRNPTYSCVVQRYSRHCVVMRYSQHYPPFHVLLSDTRDTLLLCNTRSTPYSCVVMRYSQHHSHLLLPIVLLGVALISAPTPQWILTLVSRLYASLRRRYDKFGMRTGRLCAWGRSHLYPGSPTTVTGLLMTPRNYAVPLPVTRRPGKVVSRSRAISGVSTRMHRRKCRRHLSRGHPSRHAWAYRPRIFTPC